MSKNNFKKSEEVWTLDESSCVYLVADYAGEFVYIKYDGESYQQLCGISEVDKLIDILNNIKNA